MRAGYPRWVSLMVYGAMELAVTGSDVQEVVGSAIALKLLFGLPLWAGCLVTVVDTLTFLLVHRPNPSPSPNPNPNPNPIPTPITLALTRQRGS